MAQVIGSFTCEGDVSESKIAVSVDERGIVFITQSGGLEVSEIIVMTADYIPVLKSLLDKAARENQREKERASHES